MSRPWVTPRPRAQLVTAIVATVFGCSSDEGANIDQNAAGTDGQDTGVSVLDTGQRSEDAFVDAGVSAEEGDGSSIIWVPGEHLIQFDHAGREREALVIVPASYDGQTALPLLIMCHGAGSSGPEFAARRRELIEGAEEEGVVLAFPSAVASSNGNTGWAASDDFTVEHYDPPPDDDGFLTRLLDLLEAQVKVDGVWIAGFSSGGRAAHYFAGKHPDRLRGVYPVSTNVAWNINGDWIRTGAPLGAVPITMIHGRMDTTIPYDGSETGAGVDEAVMLWKTANGCIGSPSTRTPAENVRIDTWSECSSGHDVILISMGDLDHRWPDAGDELGYDANLGVLRFMAP